jgi:hypothetical protein
MARQMRAGVTERATTIRSRTHSSARVVTERSRGFNVPSCGVATVMANAETTARRLAATALDGANLHSGSFPPE